MGCFTAPAVFSALLLLITDCSEGYSTIWQVHFHRNRKLAPKLEPIISKDESFFRDGIRKLLERWEKVVSSDRQYLNLSVHSFCFEINAFLNTKNGPN